MQILATREKSTYHRNVEMALIEGRS